MLGSSYVRVGGNWEAQHNRLKTRLLSILNISVPILISARLRVGVETPLELYSWLFRMKVVFPELWPFLIHNRIWGLVVVWYVDCGGLLRWAGRSSFWVSRCPLLLAPLALALSHGCRPFDLSGPEYWPQAGHQGSNPPDTVTRRRILKPKTKRVIFKEQELFFGISGCWNIYSKSCSLFIVRFVSSAN